MPCAARCLALSPGCPALGRQARNPRKQGRRGRYLFIPGPGYSPALPWLRTVTIYLCLSGQEHVFTETHKAQSLTLCPDTLVSRDSLVALLKEGGPDPDPKRGFLDLAQERIQGESAVQSKSKFIKKVKW
ncbi:uncharacterized protein LOC114673166 isoform X1 [Macaca mulatta]